MKLKVVKRYRDRYTKKLVEKDSVIECNDERAKELMDQKVAVPDENQKKNGKVAPVQQEV